MAEATAGRYTSTDPYAGVDWESEVRNEATKQGLDPQLAHSVAHTESSFNPRAKNKSGAQGLMQLMPDTAARHGVDPADPYQNIQGGVAELKRLSDKFGGDVPRTLVAYNGGEGSKAK